MAAPSTDDIRLRLPGFRRYAREMARLRSQLAELDARRPELLPTGAQEWADRARRFEYLWLNADKKIDLLATRPFGPAATRVLRDERTFLNADRLYTLWQAAAQMPAGAAAVAEIGVYKGGSSRLIAEALQAAGRVVPLYSCDTFRGHTIVDEALDGRHRVGKQFRSTTGRSHAPGVRKYLARYDFVSVLEGDIRETSAAVADQRAFGMVHIDVDVHPITRFCLDFFAERVLVGATLVVDDYGFTTCKGVKVAVDDFVRERDGQFWAMHLLTGQAILVRLR